MFQHKSFLAFLYPVSVALVLSACNNARTADSPPTPAVSAVPSELQRTKESEAKVSINAINRGQQVYYLENTKFSANLEQLALGLPTQTASYTYGVEVTPDGKGAIVIARAKLPELKSYVGLVSVDSINGKGTTNTIVCENEQAGTPPVIPSASAKEPTCGQGSIPVK